MTQRGQIRLTYDPEADSIQLILGDPEAHAVDWAEPADGVVVDLDENRNPICFEILNASRRYPAGMLARISIVEPVSLSQLAREYGLAEAHLRKLATAGRLQASKIGRNWASTRAAMEDYLDSRKYNAKDVEAARAS